MAIEANEVGVSFTQEVAVKVNISPGQLAELFWTMGSDHQAMFFSRLGVIAGGKMAIQLQYITDEPDLDDSGRSFMSMVGDYSAKG